MPEDISKCLNELKHRLDKSFACHVQFPCKSLYTLTLPLALDSIPHVSSLSRPFIFWGRPDRQHYRIGLGVARQVVSRGSERLQTLQQQFQQDCVAWRHDSETTTDSHPGAFCAFAFDENDQMTGPWKAVPNSLLLVPELLLEFKEGAYSLSFTCESDYLSKNKWFRNRWLKLAEKLLLAINSKQPGTTTTPNLFRIQDNKTRENWYRQVEMARAAISRGEMDKVVPARQVQVKSSGTMDIDAVFQNLIRNHASSLVVGMSLGDKTLAAATPETLLKLDNGTLSCDALGGTEKREAEYRIDNLLAHKLLQDTKSRHEHRLIVEHLSSVIGQFSRHLSIADTPSVMPLGQLQHLWTPIKAQCRPGISIFDIATQLHPTPAVAGSPVPAAKGWINQHEDFQRGWYSGSVGWLQKNGNGELAVLLRCALISGNSADLYAGAGIVKDSDPLKEWNETELKLKTMLYALGDIDPSNVGELSTLTDKQKLKSNGCC